MSVLDKITTIMSGPANQRIKPQIAEIGTEIKKLEAQDRVIPEYAFTVMGITDDDHPGHEFVGGKEYIYFDTCSKAVESFKARDLVGATEHLMRAKWDFNNWALAHYLLGCVYMESKEFKKAFDQFELACDYEPFNHRPAAIMREIARFITLNPQ